MDRLLQHLRCLLSCTVALFTLFVFAAPLPVLAQDCGDGFIDQDEECDDGDGVNGTLDSCCDATCLFQVGGTACGDQTDDVCNAANTCDGAGVCQDNFADSSTTCGDEGNECAIADTCDGAGSCTDNGFELDGTACGDGPTECSGQDTCDGAGVCNPNHEAAGTTCTDDALFCSGDETCDGSGACVSSGDPCAGDQTCYEDQDMCVDNCGNGQLDQGEECDDGNRDDDDGCNAICEEEVCGDGTVQPGLGEECDDGNTDDDDGNDVETVTLDGSGSSDPDGSIVSYEWKEGVDILSTSASFSHPFATGVHTVTLTVTDNGGASHSDDVVVTVNANQSPTANAGSDVTADDDDENGSETVTLSASASSDPDGTVTGYSWKLGTVEIGTTQTISHTFALGVHSVELTVTDNGGATDVDAVTVTVQEPPPEAPVAKAGNDQTLADDDGDGSETASLDGSASTDADGTIVAYEWREGGLVLGTSALLDVSFGVGAHTVTLEVTDEDGLSNTDNLTVTVNANVMPTANAGEDQSVTDTDGSGSEEVTLSALGSADSDGTLVSYEWHEGAVLLSDQAVFTHSLPVGTHDLTLTVTDNGGAADTDMVQVVVRDANAVPTADAGDDQTANDSDGNGSENVTLDGSGSSDSDGTIVSYEWKKGETVIATGVTPTVNLTTGEHTITLTVTDNNGATASDDVVITVTGPVQLFFDDFQGTLGLWAQSGETNWSIQSPDEVPLNGGSNTVAHAQKCKEAVCTLTSSSIDLSGLSSASLSFWRFVDDGIDGGEFLEVQIFDGSSWVQLFYWTHKNGDSNTWQFHTVDLTPYLSSNFQIRLNAKSSLKSEEVEVDDVRVTGFSS